MRLEANRSRIRQVMRAQPNTRQGKHDDGLLDELEVLAHVLDPVACELVRRYPVRSLAGGAVVGALLVTLKPWRGLLGSILGAALVRQASTASLHWMAGQAASLNDKPA